MRLHFTSGLWEGRRSTFMFLTDNPPSHDHIDNPKTKNNNTLNVNTASKRDFNCFFKVFILCKSCKLVTLKTFPQCILFSKSHLSTRHNKCVKYFYLNKYLKKNFPWYESWFQKMHRCGWCQQIYALFNMLVVMMGKCSRKTIPLAVA